MNIAIDNAPSQHIEIMIYERQTKRRQSERRKAYMRNIIYAEYDIEREGEEGEYDRNRYYGDPWDR